MCRAGGRRCPGQYDPVKREQINARRRAAYARKKAIERGEIIIETVPHNATAAQQGNAAAKSSAVSSPATNAASDAHVVNTVKKFLAAQEDLPEVMHGMEVNGESGADLWDVTDVEVPHNGMDGVFKTQNTGSLAGTYFNETTVHGILYRGEVEQEKAVESFGFAEIPEDEHYVLKRNSAFSEEQFARLSDYEMEELTNEERLGVRLFTTYHYQWINGALFGQQELDDEPLLPEHNPSMNDVSSLLAQHDATQDILDYTTSQIDSALEKGQKRQRIVYRSVEAYSSLFEEQALTASEWAHNEMEVGQEIVFDGYQSSTPAPSALRNFSSDDGLLYEILTPEGLNVADVSQFSKEQEVLLPREARYMVVDIKDNVDIEIEPGDVRYNNTIVRLVAINDKGEILDGTNS